MNYYISIRVFCCLFMATFGGDVTQNNTDKLGYQADSIKLIGSFGSKAYYVGTGPTLTWKEAWAFCRSHQMHLASIESRAEQEYVIKFVQPDHACWWLSGTDALEEGQFAWMSSGRKLGYTMWAPGNPDNAGGHEHFVELCPWGEQELGYAWNDRPNGHKLRYICEAKLQQHMTYLLVKID